MIKEPAVDKTSDKGCQTMKPVSGLKEKFFKYTQDSMSHQVFDSRNSKLRQSTQNSNQHSHHHHHEHEHLHGHTSKTPKMDSNSPKKLITEPSFIVQDLVTGAQKNDTVEEKTNNDIDQTTFGMTRIESDLLLQTPNLKGENMNRANAKWMELQSNIIQNMRAFDEDLKLKLSMNIDAIHQDFEKWNAEQKMFAKSVYDETKNKENVKECDLVPDFIKNKDQSLVHSIE